MCPKLTSPLCSVCRFELLNEPLHKVGDDALAPEDARKLRIGQGMSMARRDGPKKEKWGNYRVGDIVDRGVVHFHNRYRVCV